ncbi:hypothetical protein VNO77_22442 [Canavalia gladiata]|uniref:Uncharacterized protein n=1 Tax=Canavalia gladiata TaxID=3824 RepID=A0AAN9QEG5_CANGL
MLDCSTLFLVTIARQYTNSVCSFVEGRGRKGRSTISKRKRDLKIKSHRRHRHEFKFNPKKPIALFPRCFLFALLSRLF